MQSSDDRKRQSHCINCGKRLSFLTPLGEIRWRTCHVADEGIYCETCHATYKSKSLKDREKLPDDSAPHGDA